MISPSKRKNKIKKFFCPKNYNTINQHVPILLINILVAITCVA